MPDHPVPQGDDIILPDGTKVGSWNGEDVKDLQVEVQRIMKEQKASMLASRSPGSAMTK